MTPINRFLRDNNLPLSSNPCVSPDFCLDWPGLKERIARREFAEYPLSSVSTASGEWILIEDDRGDHAWRLSGETGASAPDALAEEAEIGGALYFPATYGNLLVLKNHFQESDPQCSIFPVASEELGQRSLGIGARFTTLHWTGVDWAMAQLGIGLTANQNSIPRELVYDVDVMLAGKLDSVPFPFIGTNVPEGHQGQSVEGMSHGCVLAKLKNGFHRRRIAWSFNADHQPIGGKFDVREDALAQGCLLASYITFDLSPELAVTRAPETAEERRQFVETQIDPDLARRVRARLEQAKVSVAPDAFDSLLCYVWPAMKKMKARDAKYQAVRAAAFTTERGRAFLRELSIDELPGLTTPETTAIMLALCSEMGMPINYVAPAFGFQKNIPYPDNQKLRELIARQWTVCQAFGASIGFHSGSGKSAENYRIMGEVTGQRLEIKTSGRYTYEMGVALSRSSDPADQELWKDWHRFTVDLAAAGAFSADKTERDMARAFIVDSLRHEGASEDVFQDQAVCRAALAALKPSSEHMFWFEYNFLYVLAAEGRADKASLGDHSPAGYRQRARFYAISEEGRLLFAKRIALYILFLAESTGLAPAETCAAARKKLDATDSLADFLAAIAP